MARKCYWLAAQGSIDLTCNYWKSDKTENEKRERERQSEVGDRGGERGGERGGRRDRGTET